MEIKKSSQTVCLTTHEVWDSLSGNVNIEHDYVYNLKSQRGATN